jgi:molybdenum cofactor guanylyltransferase
MTVTAGLILAGGAATRLGGQKALAAFLNGTLVDAVIVRVRNQVSELALNIPIEWGEADRGRYGAYPLIADAFPQRVGPLGGVVAGLEWLSALGNASWLATFPCDTPFLPYDLVAQLIAKAHDWPVVARDRTRIHGVCAIWPVDCAGLLRRGVEDGKFRSVMSAVEGLGGEACFVEADEHAFFNINKREDLSVAIRLANAAPQV